MVGDLEESRLWFWGRVELSTQVLSLPSAAILFPRGPQFCPLKQDSVTGVSRVTVGNEGTQEDGVPQGLYMGLSSDDHTRNQPPSDKVEGKKLKWI